MLKSILSARKNVYIENTDELKFNIDFTSVKHLYGLASGWKTPWIAKQIGLEKLDSVVVYDTSQLQLEWAKKLHSYKHLPKSMEAPHYHVGTYRVPEWTNDWWDKDISVGGERKPAKLRETVEAAYNRFFQEHPEYCQA
jgi:hypothetical protein